MHRFNVPNMTCGHCVSAITRAVKGRDPAAQVAIDLAGRLVEVQSALSRQELVHAIAQAGYTPASG